jgi:hypothetical protein
VERPTNRQELASRSRSAERREYVWLAAAVAPAALLVLLPGIFGRKELFPNLSNSAGMWLYFGALAWIFAILLGPYRLVSKRAGLDCPKCGHRFERASLEIVMATRHCGGCGELVLKDEVARDA